MLTIITLSLLVAIKSKSLKMFHDKLWSHIAIILSEHYSRVFDDNVDMFFKGLWLVSCTIMLAAFPGPLLDRMMKPQPIYLIDSYKDLADRDYLRIDSFEVWLRNLEII